MRITRLHYAALAVIAMSFSSCMSEAGKSFIEPASDVQEVCFAVNTGTKVAINPNGISFKWEKGDTLSLWAMDELNQLTLADQKFAMNSSFGTKAYFTSSLSQAMAPGSYKYAVCHPVPLSCDSLKAVFNIPVKQDGTFSSLVMVSDTVRHCELASRPEVGEGQMLSVSLEHKTHLLRFFIPAGTDPMEGEAIERILITMPVGISGTMTMDMFDRSAVDTSATSNTIELLLEKPLMPQQAEGDENFACAIVLPVTFADSTLLQLEAYSLTKKANFNPIVLSAGAFEAGHVTPVRLVPSSVESSKSRQALLKLTDNKRGEDIRTIQITAPEGIVWNASGTNVLSFSAPEGAIAVGKEYECDLDVTDYAGKLSEVKLDVVFISDHVKSQDSVTVSFEEFKASVEFAVSYLLDENFDDVPTFSSYDDYSSGFNTGSKPGYAFLDGWSGGRIGASEGLCVRVAARRETSFRYNARLDSAPLPEITSPVTLLVTFDWGANNQYGGIGSGDYAQITYLGYVNSLEVFDSGDEDGTHYDENLINSNEKTGSYTNTPNTANFPVAVPAGNTIRISWLSKVEDHAGANNTTTWLYVDNVKVQVAPANE